MVIALNDSNPAGPAPSDSSRSSRSARSACSSDRPDPSRRKMPQPGTDPLAFGRGCLIAAAAAAVFWLAALWFAMR